MDAEYAEVNLKKWNYRMVDFGGYLTIHEVYYDPNGVPRACTERPSFPSGETLAELQEDIQRYTNALELPVLPSEIFDRPSDD